MGKEDKPEQATEQDLDDLENLINSCIVSVQGDSDGEKAHRAKYARMSAWLAEARGGKDSAAKREKAKTAPGNKPAPKAEKPKTKPKVAPKTEKDLGDLS